MKDNNKNIDDFVRDQLKDRQFDGPPKDFMDDLNQRLDNRERLGFFGPWNSILDVLLIILFLISPFFEGNDQLSTDQQPRLVKQEQNNKSSDMSGSSTDDDTQRLTTDTRSTEHKQKDSEVSSPLDRTSSNTNLSINNKTSGSSSAKTADKSNINDSDNKGINTTNSEESQTSDKIKKESSQKDAKQRTESNDNSNESKLNIKQSKVNISGDKTNKNNDSSPQMINRLSNSQVYASQFSIIEPKIRNWDFPPILSSQLELPVTKGEPVKSTGDPISPFSWEVQLTSGLNFPSLNKDKGVNGSELTLNNQTGFAPSFTIGGRVTMWWNKFSLTSGADLLSVKEENLFEFNEVDTYDSTYISSIDTTVTYDSTNQQWDTTYTYYYDSTTVTDSTVSLVPVNQQYTWLQVPLQVGYRFQLNNWAIIPRAGINLAIGIRQTNKTYPNEAFDQLQSYAPSAKVLMNLSGSLEVRRRFGNWHIFVRGDYQTGMRPILTGDYFERRYSGFRMNVGVGLTLD